MAACDSSTYSMLTCTVFDLHSIQCFITHRYWYWPRPILLGIGCLVWYRSNPNDWTRDQCITVAQLSTGHSPLLAAYLHRIGRRDSATCPHCNIALMRQQNICCYTAQHTTGCGGSHGQIFTIKVTQDAYGASWRGSGQ